MLIVLLFQFFDSVDFLFCGVYVVCYQCLDCWLRGYWLLDVVLRLG